MKRIFLDFNSSEYAVYDRQLPTENVEISALVKQFADSGTFYVVCTKDADEMIGYVCFHNIDDKLDVGYCFHSSFHGQGYAYESVCALIEHFVNVHGIRTFTAGTAMANKPSCRLLEKLGFARISTEMVSFDGSFSFEGGNYELKR